MQVLITLAAAGNQAAIGTMIRELRPLLRQAAKKLSRQTGMDAQDLEQEGWLGVWEALARVDAGIGRAEVFLLKCGRWRMLDAVKRSVRRPLVLLEEEPELEGRGLELDPVAICLGTLAPGQRKLTELLLAGYTWREAGAQLGCSSANIAYHVRKLKDRWNEIGV